MTSIVGILCRDGVVVAADSSATFGDGGNLRTIEQPTDGKIEIIGEQIILAGTGYVGHQQRFCEVLKQLYVAKNFQNKSPIDIAKMMSSAGISDFAQTHIQQLRFSAFVAYPSQDKACLCELPGGPVGFQPEIKEVDRLWFTSAGSGQPITDPFLALFRTVFWSGGPPNLRGGIFTALWALRHACDVNPGGIKEPIHIAVLGRQGGKLRARMLTDDELLEHGNIVTNATEHMAAFLNVLEGKVQAQTAPVAPQTGGQS